MTRAWASLGLLCLLVGCHGGDASSPEGECAGPGRYQVGKGDQYLPCCKGLKTVHTATGAYGGNDGKQKVCSHPPLNVYMCIEGTCGDGTCEKAESEPCGCEQDCPSAVWGPSDQPPAAP